MRSAIWAFLCYLAFVAQGSLAPAISLGPYAPQFLILALVSATCALGDGPGILVAAALGLLSDALAPIGLGTDVVCFTVAAFVIQQISWRGNLRAPVLRCLFHFVTILLIGAVSVTVRTAISGGVLEPLSCLDLASGSAGYTALLSCGGALVCGWIWRSVAPAPAPGRGVLGRC